MSDEEANSGAQGVRSRKPSDEGGWCWAARDALEVVNAVAAETNQVPLARSVYVALTQMAPKSAPPVFDAKRVVVATLAGVRIRSLDAANQILAKAGAIRYERVTDGRGMDVCLRYTLLSVRNKCTAVRNVVADRSGNGSETTERIEMTPGAKALGRGDGLASPKASKRQNRPLPSNEEALEFACREGIRRETAVAFLWYQHANQWSMWDPRAKKWETVFDWQTALQRFAEADAKRTVLPDKLSNAEFNAWVREAGLDFELVNAWIKVMSRNGWRIRNPKTNRMEPVHDCRAACLAFCENSITQVRAEYEKL